jgi:hypothetical protein
MNDVEPVAGQQTSELENLKNNSSSGHGGARNGAGRKKGGMNYSTKQRLAIRKSFEDRIHHNADTLLNAALTKALGESYLFHRYKVGSGAKERMETEIVTDPQTIMEYLDEQLDNLPDNEYYYISTKPVDMVAVKELYDRAFGKPLQKNELSGKDGEPLSLGLTPEQADQLLKLRAGQVEPSAN